MPGGDPTRLRGTVGPKLTSLSTAIRPAVQIPRWPAATTRARNSCSECKTPVAPRQIQMRRIPSRTDRMTSARIHLRVSGSLRAAAGRSAGKSRIDCRSKEKKSPAPGSTCGPAVSPRLSSCSGGIRATSTKSVGPAKSPSCTSWPSRGTPNCTRQPSTSASSRRGPRIRTARFSLRSMPSSIRRAGISSRTRSRKSRPGFTATNSASSGATAVDCPSRGEKSKSCGKRLPPKRTRPAPARSSGGRRASRDNNGHRVSKLRYELIRGGDVQVDEIVYDHNERKISYAPRAVNLFPEFERRAIKLDQAPK